MSDEAPTIVWFRQDLRLQDNAALAAAVDAGATVIPLFIWAPDEAGDWAPGAASRWWLHKSLQDLERSWKQLGGRLLLRRGDSLAVLRDVVEKSGAARVFWNRRYEPALREVDAQVKRLESQIDSMNDALEPLRSFVLPGGSALAAHLHLCRTVARRAERLVMELASLEEINPAAVQYLNRLSDWFFVASRIANDAGRADVLWVPGKNR